MVILWDSWNSTGFPRSLVFGWSSSRVSVLVVFTLANSKIIFTATLEALEHFRACCLCEKSRWRLAHQANLFWPGSCGLLLHVYLDHQCGLLVLKYRYRMYLFHVFMFWLLTKWNCCLEFVFWFDLCLSLLDKMRQYRCRSCAWAVSCILESPSTQCQEQFTSYQNGEMT